MGKFSKTIIAFLVIFLFATFYYGAPQKTYAAACSDLTGNAFCIQSGVCRGEGGRSVSGTGCGSGQICCCPPKLDGSPGDCQPPPAPPPTTSTCSSRGAFCAPSGVCRAEGGTFVSGTGCTGTNLCCCFGGTCPVPANNCTDRTRIHTSTNNSSTNWRVKIQYHHSGNMLPYTADSNPDGYTYVGNIGFSPDSGDWFKWWTACVDPRVEVEGYKFEDMRCQSVGGTDYDIWQFNVDVACHDIYYGSTEGRIYAGCGTNYGNNFGTVEPGEVCPTNSCYCTKGGSTSFPNNCCSGGVKYCAANGYECGNPPPSCTTPAVPGGRSDSSDCNASDNPQINMNWDAGTNADEYNIQYGRSGSSTTTTINGITGTSRSVSSGIALDTDYQWRIQSVNNCSGNTSAVSNWINSQWTSIPRTPASCATPPPTPTNVNASSQCTSATASRIDIDWTTVSGATSYDLRYKRSNVATWTNDNNITTTSRRITGLLTTANYDYEVRSTNTAGNSAYSAIKTITTASGNACVAATYSISGNVCVDKNKDGDCADTADYNKSDVTVAARQSGSNIGSGVTNANGNYSIGSLPAGTYTVRLTAPSGFVLVTGNDLSRTLGPDTTANFRLNEDAVPTYPVSVGFFYDDLSTGSNNITYQASERCYNPGATIGLRPNGAAANTQTQYSSKPYDPDTCLMTIPNTDVAHILRLIKASIPNVSTALKGYTYRDSTTGGTYRTVALTRNFINNNQVERLLQGSTIRFAITPTCAPTPLATACAGRVCGQVPDGCGGQWTCGTCSGSDTCNASGQCVASTKTVSGKVWVDDKQAGNGTQDTGETNYTSGSVSITATNTVSGQVTNSVAGASPGEFTLTLPGDQDYTVRYTNPPSGYERTWPPGVTYSPVHLPCAQPSDAGGANASCDASQNVVNLNFGINNTRACIQAVDGDIRIDGGYDCPLPPDDPPPTDTCDSTSPVISSGAGGAAGIVYSGGNQSNFGSSATLNPNILNVDINSGATPFTPVIPRTIRTRYSYILANVRQARVPGGEKSLTSPVNYCGAGGTGNCNLSGSIPEGVYVVNGPLNITGSGRFTFPDGTASNINNYVILASGEITIGKEIWVGNNSNALFASGTDIRVRPNVGTSNPESSIANLKGFYSADRNFIIESYANCPAQDDLRLNIEGSIIANGGLSGGSVILDRSLCANLNKCPALSVRISPRLILSSPGVLKVPSYVWKEVAP